jgi:hypothetical protein
LAALDNTSLRIASPNNTPLFRGERPRRAQLTSSPLATTSLLCSSAAITPRNAGDSMAEMTFDRINLKREPKIRVSVVPDLTGLTEHDFAGSRCG